MNTTLEQLNVQAPQATPNPTFFTPGGGIFQLGGGREAVVDENGVWKNRLGLESTEEHRHVSKIWQDKCLRATDFYQKVCEDTRNTRDRLIESSALVLTNDLKLKRPKPSKFTRNGISTLLNNVQMSMTTLDYLVDMNEEKKAAELINRELRASEAAQSKGEGDMGKRRLVRFRTVGDGGEEVVRAVLSEGYTKGLSNQRALEMFIDAIPKGALDDVLVSHLVYDGDYLCTNLILPDYIKDPRNRGYGSMLQLRNSEIGRNCFWAGGGLFEAICLNGCVWGWQEMTMQIEQRHWGNVDLGEIQRGVKKLYELVVTMGNAMAEQAERLTDVKLDDPNSVIVMLGEEFKLSQEQQRAWLRGYRVTLDEPGGGNESTAFGVWNGLTRGAQEFSGDTRLSMEQNAGTLLAPAKEIAAAPLLTLWDNVKDRALAAQGRKSFVERKEKLLQFAFA